MNIKLVRIAHPSGREDHWGGHSCADQRSNQGVWDFY